MRSASRSKRCGGRLAFFREKVSGAFRDRPELNRMLDQLRNGDVVTVWKLDRFARSTRKLLEIVELISNAGSNPS
jgi:DNA invertase Pin-like site-specific DNA recombinase